jgi:hypothetical protein
VAQSSACGIQALQALNPQAEAYATRICRLKAQGFGWKNLVSDSLKKLAHAAEFLVTLVEQLRHGQP